jgi:transaldolase
MPPPVLTTPPPRIVDGVRAFIHEGIAREPRAGSIARPSAPFWQGLSALGTALWLDTGDMEAASGEWTGDFSALTTNNTLLNAEVQKGIYDDLVRKAARLFDGLGERARVIEIGFILNALHGLRLVRRFGARVSVELHTDLAGDVEGTLAYARRYRDISPERFIIKVPLTPAGLIATRRLREEGIPVNLTLGFSARQNFVAAAFARPSFVNVFLGRLRSYVKENGLGTGERIGEKATLASQRAVKARSLAHPEPTLQIAASLREADEVSNLAGVDVFTLPVKVAREARERLDGRWRSRREEDYSVALGPGGGPAVKIESLWEVAGPVRALAQSLAAEPPAAPEALVDRAHALGAGDLFPRLSREDLARLAADGKIPRHAAWAARIARGELAIDVLLNAAGLASFAADQKALDDRVSSLLG